MTKTIILDGIEYELVKKDITVTISNTLSIIIDKIFIDRHGSLHLKYYSKKSGSYYTESLNRILECKENNLEYLKMYEAMKKEPWGDFLRKLRYL